MTKKPKELYLASPRGFCSGVNRAVKIVDLVLKKHGPPIYVRHQIVHNRHVVNDFEKKGVIFIEDIDKVPSGSIIIFSAHGTPPEIYAKAKKKKLKVYDAACPLVTKVHLEAKRYEKEGYYIIYIGHRNHPEPIGVIGEVSSKSIAFISTLDDVNKVEPPQTEKIIVLSQTTLSLDDTEKIIRRLRIRFPKLILPPSSDICFSTQNRQNAVKELAKKAELILVIGSKESSNCNRLKKTAEKSGVPAYLINDKSEIKYSWFENIERLGITAGASTPDYLVDEIVSLFKKQGVIIYEIETIKENISFPLLKNL